MIRIAGRNVFCSRTIPQNATDKLVLIFLHDALGCSESWKEFLLNYVTKWKQRVLYDRLGHGNQTSGYHGQRLP
jgi:pimeloyl-ACP methyl ester carboxylesterase